MIDLENAAPDEFLSRALAAPVLQPLTPAWGRQSSSASARQPGPAQIFFPKWKQHPSSGFRPPVWSRPPASAPAHSVFARRGATGANRTTRPIPDE